MSKKTDLTEKESLTEDEIVLDLAKNEHSRNILKNSRNDLSLLHFSLGMAIRNEYGLWKREWKPQIKDGIDEAPDHPDAISQRIIEKLYEHWLNKTNKSVDN
jgi:hypothetical protein